MATGEEGPGALSCQGHRKWPLGQPGWLREQWHRRLSGHIAGPDSLSVHCPSPSPTSAGSWLCPMGLGAVLEYCASKGLDQADAPLCDSV